MKKISTYDLLDELNLNDINNYTIDNDGDLTVHFSEDTNIWQTDLGGILFNNIKDYLNKNATLIDQDYFTDYVNYSDDLDDDETYSYYTWTYRYKNYQIKLTWLIKPIEDDGHGHSEFQYELFAKEV